MFQSRAQEPHVVYLCYERWLFCISHPHSCSTNIINQKGKPAGLIRWHCNSKKFLKSFLKKIWIKWIVSLCDEMVEARHFSDTWSWQTCNITDNTRNVSIHISGMDGACTNTAQAHLQNCAKYITVENKTAYLKIYKNCLKK